MKSRANRHQPVFDISTHAKFDIGGFMGSRIHANQRNWLMVAPVANPSMLTMFRDHNPPLSIPTGYVPSRDLIVWSGEFAGKYLISGVQGLRLTQDPHLRAMLGDFVTDLIGYQDPDGYLGPFEKGQRMDGLNPYGYPLWDLWGQYHCLLGLYYWYKETGDSNALSACRRTADLFCRTFLDSGKSISKVGEQEKNLACSHIFTLLYQEVGDPRYLRLVREIEIAWTSKDGGNYVSGFQNGEAFFQGKMQRWESLHSVQAVAELYFITGDQKYHHAFIQIWRSILSTDRHNTGGFSSAEAASGNPFDPRPIETCATIAWMALTLDMLRLTGNPRAADELEMSTWNAVLGAQDPDGRWWTYNTPMGGVATDNMDDLKMNPPLKFAPAFLGERRPAVYDIGWQDRRGASYLSCCAANGPRGLGMLSEWAVMTAPGGIVLNYYGPGEFTVSLPSGRNLRLIQDTNYPVTGKILLRVMPEIDEHFTLRLRIPYWSNTTVVILNGEPLKDVVPGTYLILARVWKSTDILELTLDMSLRYWVGGPRPTNAISERVTGAGAVGKISIYHGPVLLAYDPRYDRYDPAHLPSVTQSDIPPVALPIPHPIDPLLQVQIPLIRSTITLCDFASAGAAISPYPVGRPDINKFWQFSREDGHIIAEEILLLSDGTIGGYSHPNEARWGFEGDTVVFYAQDGTPTTRFTWLSMESGRMILRGFFANRQITHVLRELDPEIVGKYWQFARIDNTTSPPVETVLNELMQLHHDGTLSGSSHPNETRWGFSAGKLAFYAQDDKISTRFSHFSTEHGKMVYSGQFLPDPNITHFLREMDLGLTNKIWQFNRPSGNPISIRLLPDGTIDGNDHPNETRWWGDGTTLVFYAADERVSTRFTSIKSEKGSMLRQGTFEFDHSIQHYLLEWNIDLGWGLGNPYVSWLNSPDKSVLTLSHPAL